MLDNTVSSSNTSDNTVSEQRVESVDPKLFEELHGEIYPDQVDAEQTNQKLVFSGHIPALEIVSTESAALNDSGRAIEEELTSVKEKTAFNTMISTDGQKVFASPNYNAANYFDIVDGLDDPGNIWNGKDGKITKEGLTLFVETQVAASGTRQLGYRDPGKAVFIDSARHLLENWDSPELAKFKEDNGAMSKESFARGMESLPASREQLASTKIDLQLRTKEWLNEVNSQVVQADTSNAEPGDTAGVSTSEAQTTSSVLSEDSAQLSLVRRGEGPYGVAERILSVGGAASSDEIWALTKAMQAQYAEEYPQDPKLASLKVGHQFLTPEKADHLMELIPNEEIRDSIRAKIYNQQEPQELQEASQDQPESQEQQELQEQQNPDTTQPVFPERESSSDSNLSLASVAAREAFNNMIATDGKQVFSQTNRQVSKLFDAVDGQDDPGTFWNGKDGVITREGIHKFLATATVHHGRGGINPMESAFIKWVKQLDANWDNREMNVYKNSTGAMTRESFAKGMQSLQERLDQVAMDRAALNS
jgi:hypothetical protein